MILIYVSHINPRIAYIAKFIFSEVLNTPYEITVNKDDFLQYEGPRINYSFEAFDAITILPNRFMNHKGLSDVDPGVSWVNDIPVLFHECADVSMPFDPFAASFYLVTRYEEYINTERDMHGRFTAASSLAHKHGFLELPVIDVWAKMIKDVIQLHYPKYRFGEKKFTYIPTIDVDIAFAYKGRSVFRNVGAVLKSGLNLKQQLRRMKTWIGMANDPYNTFDQIHGYHSTWNLSPVFFIQAGKYGKFDKNLPPHHPLMQELINRVSNVAEIGIHPSYQSHLDKQRVMSEKDALAQIVGRDITKSRQHFLRFALPDTFRILEKCGIQEDYSMGYADGVGFRAGTCTPFLFYDLSAERETGLKIFPFCIMDGTLNQYMGLKPDEAVLKVADVARKVKAVNGTMVTIWHNQSFSGLDGWANWETVYLRALQAILI